MSIFSLVDNKDPNAKSPKLCSRIPIRDRRVSIGRAEHERSRALSWVLGIKCGRLGKGSWYLPGNVEARRVYEKTMVAGMGNSDQEPVQALWSVEPLR